uniref:Uncharacterized protein n=1 Tax=Arundo donax TaxID=35708 RepID=A0A0A9CDP2_ARUDO
MLQPCLVSNAGTVWSEHMSDDRSGVCSSLQGCGCVSTS